MKGKSFLDFVEERYGNPNAVFAGNAKIVKYSMVYVILSGKNDTDGYNRVCPAKYLGKKRYKVNIDGKIREVEVPRQNVLLSI